MEMSNILSTVQNITKDEHKFLSIQENVYEELKSITKQLYDNIQKNEIDGELQNALPELNIVQFDHEQIWQQLELQNECINDFVVSNLATLLVTEDVSFNLNNEALNNDEIDFNDGSENQSDKGDELEDQIDAGDELEDLIDEGDESEDQAQEKHIKKSSSANNLKKETVVNANFINKMEQDLILLQNKMVKTSHDDDSDESIDLFQESDEEDDDEDKNNFEEYDLSYDQSEKKESVPIESEEQPKRKNKVRFNLNDDSEESDNSISSEIENKETKTIDDKHKSSLESRLERQKEKFKQLQEKALTPANKKPWQIKGEVSGTTRPINTILEEILEFDTTSRPAPVITYKTTLKLEDIIKQRIKDKSWDDVERKSRPRETPHEYKKRIVLDQEKSKLSLAEIYEKEYLQQKENITKDPLEEKPEEEPETHKQIKTDMANLFHILDALSQNHFTPKMAMPEVKIVSNLPAILMEEVIPVAMNNETLLAPEEIKTKLKGELIDKSERTSTDKKRERRKKKNHQRAVHNYLDSKTKKDLENKKGSKALNEKELIEKVSKERNVSKINENKKRVKSSTDFFTQLQNETSSHIKKNFQKDEKKITDKFISNLKL